MIYGHLTSEEKLAGVKETIKIATNSRKHGSGRNNFASVSIRTLELALQYLSDVEEDLGVIREKLRVRSPFTDKGEPKS